MSKQSKDMIVVGAIAGAHGVRGDVRVKSFTADPVAMFEYAPFLSEKGAVLLDPKSFRAAKDHFVVTPKRPLQKEEWDGLKSTKLYVPRDCLPDPDEDEFYIDQLVGLTVLAENHAVIGKIKAVLDHGAGDLLEIQPKAGGKTVLVPFTRADVPLINIADKQVVVATFEIWADETKPEDEH